MNEDIQLWDPSREISQAKDLMHSSNFAKVGEAREKIESTISHWTNAIQTLQENEINIINANEKIEMGIGKITELWSLYASLEMELRQFKQATKVLDNATNSILCCDQYKLWKQYANFCMERKKLTNARKVFTKGVTSLKGEDAEAYWLDYLEFVHVNSDPNITLEDLKSQIIKKNTDQNANANEPQENTDKTPSITTLSPGKELSPELMEVDQSKSAHSSLNGKETELSVKMDKGDLNTLDVSSVLDPSLAFVDKMGLEDAASLPKNNVPTSSNGQLKYFETIPTTLPIIPSCPHLLFDVLGDGESFIEVGDDIVEALSDALGNPATFECVKDLMDIQRQKDRDTLARWQDLIALQMKEGSELFTMHMEKESTIDEGNTRELIECKTDHLNQRREFVNRCQMSQQQFIDITGFARQNTLKSQQISLENMKIPHISVTSDSKVIELQRAIIGLIVEAEKLWRREQESDCTISSTITQPVNNNSRPIIQAKHERNRRDRSTSSTRSSSGMHVQRRNHRRSPSPYTRFGRAGRYQNNSRAQSTYRTPTDTHTSFMSTSSRYPTPPSNTALGDLHRQIPLHHTTTHRVPRDFSPPHFSSSKMHQQGRRSIPTQFQTAPSTQHSGHLHRHANNVSYSASHSRQRQNMPQTQQFNHFDQRSRGYPYDNAPPYTSSHTAYGQNIQAQQYSNSGNSSILGNAGRVGRTGSRDRGRGRFSHGRR